MGWWVGKKAKTDHNVVSIKPELGSKTENFLSWLGFAIHSQNEFQILQIVLSLIKHLKPRPNITVHCLIPHDDFKTPTL